MAEFIEPRCEVGTWIGPRPEITEGPHEGMNAMGQPVPLHRRQNALDHLEAMGITSRLRRVVCVGMMADRLERDRPYDAMKEGMRFVDLTGTYRLMAVLLTGDEPEHALSTDDALSTQDASALIQREKDARIAVAFAEAEAAKVKDRADKNMKELIARQTRKDAATAGIVRDAAEAVKRAHEEANRKVTAERLSFEQRVADEVARRLYGDIPDVPGEKRKRPVVL